MQRLKKRDSCLRPQRKKNAAKQSRAARAQRLRYDGNYIDRRRTDVLAGVIFIFHRLSRRERAPRTHTTHTYAHKGGEREEKLRQ